MCVTMMQYTTEKQSRVTLNATTLGYQSMQSLQCKCTSDYFFCLYCVSFEVLSKLTACQCTAKPKHVYMLSVAVKRVHASKLFTQNKTCALKQQVNFYFQVNRVHSTGAVTVWYCVMGHKNLCVYTCCYTSHLIYPFIGNHNQFNSIRMLPVILNIQSTFGTNNPNSSPFEHLGGVKQFDFCSRVYFVVLELQAEDIETCVSYCAQPPPTPTPPTHNIKVVTGSVCVLTKVNLCPLQ